MASKIKKPAKVKKTVSSANNFKMLNDRDHVRLRKGVYIPNINYTVYELIDNGMDEHTRGYGNELELSINKDGAVRVRDYGRGLPIEQSEDEPDCTIGELCLSRLRAGTKFESSGKTGGLNGLGSSAINFLCEYFKVWIVKEDGKNYYMEFEKGLIKEKMHEIDPIYDKSGTIIECLPDPEMWKDLDDFNINEINNRMKQLCYLNPGVKITVDIEYDNHNIHEIYDFPEGVKTYIEDLTVNSEMVHEPWTINKSVEIKDGETCDISVSFVWTNSYRDSIYAFTNNVANTDLKSSNITGFRRGIAAAVKDCFENEYPKSKTQLTAEDTREGIVAVVSIKVDSPAYVSQGKDYLNMPIVASILYSEIKEFCEDQFDKLPNDKDNILNKVIESNKIREAAHKAKEAAKKNKTVSYGKVDGLTKCTSKKPHERFIWLTEGDSAGGTAKQARDEKVDAILPVFGKIPNVYDKTIDKVLSSDKIMMIAKALECGVGEDFDIENLAYHHVVILSDGDPDGEHIRCLYITLFYKYMRPLIEEGHLYIAQPPLYTIRVNPRTKKEKTIFAYNKTELDEKCAAITERYEVQRNKGLGEMSYEELRESTMNKDTRRLIKVTIDDVAAAEEMLSVCMYDKNIAARKQFILSNKPGGDMIE